MVTEYMGPIGLEPKSNNYEHAHELAEAISEEFLKRYDLDGHGIEETTGVKYDSDMDFWSYEMLQNNKGEKPKSKEEVVTVFEEIINGIYEWDLSNKSDSDLNKVYNTQRGFPRRLAAGLLVGKIENPRFSS